MQTFNNKMNQGLGKELYAKCGTNWATLAQSIFNARLYEQVAEENKLSYVKKLINCYKIQFQYGTKLGTLKE